MARVALELGGNNALVVCEDADLDYAAYWTLRAAFSNAGQRCASASRIAAKNLRSLDTHPLIASTIVVAASSGIFDAVVVSAGSERYADRDRLSDH